MKEATAESLIIGIDCATERTEIGVAVAASSEETLQLAELFRANQLGKDRSVAEFLENKVVESRKDGKSVLLVFDAPLGWPEAMRTELATHAAGKPLATARQRMFSRLTDRFVYRQTRKKPLDVGADRIAKTAHWALELLEQIRDATGEEIPLAWGPDQVRGVTVIEVYPALALLALAPEGEERLKFGAGYKKKPERDRKTRKVVRDPGLGAREVIWDQLRCLRAGGPLEESGTPDTDHEIDAVLCVQVAFDFLRGRCAQPPGSLLADVLRREGWIWFNKRAVQDGVGADSRDSHP